MADRGRGMALPAAVTLLAHHTEGGTFVANVAKEVAVAGAEVGDLARLNLLAVRGDRLHVLAPGPTGVWWSDAVLAPLVHRRTPVKAYRALIRRARDGALVQHRQALVASGLVTTRPARRLGIFPYDKHVPDPAAQAWVLGSLRRALRGERPLDLWTAQLATVVHHTGLAARWLGDSGERRALEHIARGEVSVPTWEASSPRPAPSSSRQSRSPRRTAPPDPSRRTGKSRDETARSRRLPDRGNTIGRVDRAAVKKSVDTAWDEDVLPSLCTLVEIPAVSPAFDPEWASSGHLDAVVAHVHDWISARGITGAHLEVVRLPGRTPLLMVDVPASEGASTETALLYGHLDKQPPVGGWSEGLDPWKPVLSGGRLYGRGAVDDGYSGYAAITAIEALRANGGAHSRCVLLLETGEESGSPDLPAYIEHLSDRLGRVSLVVCLDSGGGDYERLWLTTSLRGMVQLNVTVRVLDAGQHSGMASGLVPSSFRVARALLDRLEDSATGEILLPELNVAIPIGRAEEARAGVEAAPGLVRESLPLPEGMRMISDDEVELALNNWWRPTMSVIGADGLPRPEDAGNVLRPYTTLDLSFRLPPTADPRAALDAIRSTLEADVPYGARVEFGHEEAGSGFDAPDTAPWLRQALDAASDDVFGRPWRTMGLGGSIPFMGLLHENYPDAQFVVTGALGPGSNAHVPDESLDLAYAAKVTSAVAYVLDAHARR